MIEQRTQGMAKRWHTVDDIYEWFCYVNNFCKTVHSLDITSQFVREVITDARHARTFVEFCDYVVLHRNVRII